MFEAIDRNGDVVFATNIETEKRSIGDPAKELEFIKTVKNAGLKCIPGHDEDQHRVYFRSASRHLDGRIRKVPHFSHYSGEGHGCKSGGSQREHDDVLFMIYQTLKDKAQGKMTIKGRLGDRVANLHFFHNQEQFALEYEHTAFTEEQMLEKLVDYSGKGIATIFVLNHDLLDTTCSEAIMRQFGVVYFFDDSSSSIIEARLEPSLYTGRHGRRDLDMYITDLITAAGFGGTKVDLSEISDVSMYITSDYGIRHGFLSDSAAYMPGITISIEVVNPDQLPVYAYPAPSPGVSSNDDVSYDSKKSMLINTNMSPKEVSRAYKLFESSKGVLRAAVGEKVNISMQDYFNMIAISARSLDQLMELPWGLDDRFSITIAGPHVHVSTNTDKYSYLDSAIGDCIGVELSRVFHSLMTSVIPVGKKTIGYETENEMIVVMVDAMEKLKRKGLTYVALDNSLQAGMASGFRMSNTSSLDSSPKRLRRSKRFLDKFKRKARFGKL